MARGMVAKREGDRVFAIPKTWGYIGEVLPFSSLIYTKALAFS